MEFAYALVAAVVGYLAGSVSFSRILTRLLSRDTDLSKVTIQDEVSGATYQRRPSAMTVSMALGWKVGCAVSVLDILKVTLPVLALRLLLPGPPYFLIAAAAAVAGHNWPVFYRFKGGSGISAIYGGLLAVDPLAIAVSSLGGLVVGLGLLRSFAVMFILSLLLIIPWMAWRFDEPAYWIWAVAVNLLYLVTLVGDIRPYLKPGARLMREREVMQQMPMGRAMIKMMDALRLRKPKTQATGEAATDGK